MISRYEVTLNGNPMSEIDEQLLILDVEYAKPAYDLRTAVNGSLDGARITGRYKESAEVTVSFELHLYGIADRQAACQKVISWARDGGILEINDRPDQRLHVVCSEFPAISSVRNWTDPLQITFTAYPLPWWEDTEETSVTLNGKKVNGYMELPGSGGDARVSVSIMVNGYLTTLNLRAGDTVLKLAGLAIASGGTLEIGYTDEQLIYIRSGSTSLLGKRTNDSADDLLLPSGKKSTIGIDANTNIRATFKARGCWM